MQLLHALFEFRRALPQALGFVQEARPLVLDLVAPRPTLSKPYLQRLRVAFDPRLAGALNSRLLHRKLPEQAAQRLLARIDWRSELRSAIEQRTRVLGGAIELLDPSLNLFGSLGKLLEPQRTQRCIETDRKPIGLAIARQVGCNGVEHTDDAGFSMP